MVILPEVLLLLRIVSAILGVLLFQMNLQISLSNSVKKAQKPGSWFEQHCTYTLRNDGDLAGFEARARALLTHIIYKEDI